MRPNPAARADYDFRGIEPEKWAVFLLVLLRTSTLLITLPFFSSQNIDNLVKAGFALSLAVLLSPVVRLDPQLLPRDLIGVGMLGLQEVMIGGILGLSVRLLMTSVQIMGQLVGFQMGFAVANVIDPMGGGQVAVLAQFVYLMTLLVMLVVGGHYYFFMALADSFVLVPPGSFAFSHSLMDQIMSLAVRMFSLAIRLGAPVIGALLFTQVTLGVLAKTVPQMNILMVGFPITISVGLIFLSLTPDRAVARHGQHIPKLRPHVCGADEGDVRYAAAGAPRKKPKKPPQGGRDKAREQGQVAKSQEINSVAVLLAGMGALYLMGGYMYDQLSSFNAPGHDRVWAARRSTRPSFRTSAF